MHRTNKDKQMSESTAKFSASPTLLRISKLLYYFSLLRNIKRFVMCLQGEQDVTVLQ